MLAQGDDVAPIPGTKRVKYLEENVGAADVTLTDDDLAALEDAVPRDAVVGDRYGDMSIDRRLTASTRRWTRPPDEVPPWSTGETRVAAEPRRRVAR